MAGHFLAKCSCTFLVTGVFVTGCTILLVMAFPVAQITIGAVYMYECPAAPVIPVYVMVCGILALLIMASFALPKLLCPTALSNTIWTLWMLSLFLFVFIWFFYGSYQIYSIYPPNYTKITIDTNIFNNSIYIPTVPDRKPVLTLGNQSLPNLNQTWMINSNQTLVNLIQTLALSNTSSQTNREHLSTPQVMAVVPYCDRSVYLFAFWTTTLVYVFAGHALVIIICLYGFMIIVNKCTELFTT